MVATFRDHRSAENCSNFIEPATMKKEHLHPLFLFIATSYSMLFNYLSVFECPIVFVIHLSAARSVHVTCTGLLFFAVHILNSHLCVIPTHL